MSSDNSDTRFDDGPSLESQNSSVQDFDLLSNRIANELYVINSDLNTIKRLLSRIGSSRSTKNNEVRLTELIEDAGHSFKSFSNDIKTVADWNAKSLTPTQRFTQQKLSKEFATILNDFREVQRTAKEKLRSLSIAERAAVSASSSNSVAINEDATEQTPLIQDQQQRQVILEVANQQDVDFMSSLVQEREQEIHNIEQGITEINSIVRDLGSLVSEQGAQLDTVEENISSLASNMENSSKQLRKADEYQRKRRNCTCWVLTALIIILAVILLIILS